MSDYYNLIKIYFYEIEEYQKKGYEIVELTDNGDNVIMGKTYKKRVEELDELLSLLKKSNLDRTLVYEFFKVRGLIQISGLASEIIKEERDDFRKSKFQSYFKDCTDEEKDLINHLILLLLNK